MTKEPPEADWKVFRELRERALDRFCERVLDDAAQLATSTTGSPHERYLRLFAHLGEQNQEMAYAFDAPRRSVMLVQLAAICRHGLLTPEEVGRFTEKTRATLQSLSADR